MTATTSRTPSRPDRLFTVRDVAARLGYHPKSIYPMIRRGDLPAPIRIRNRVFWDRGDIERWLEANR